MSETKSLYDKATAAYLGLAVGDALGATVEFMTPQEIQAEYKVHQEMIGGGWLKLKPGNVTDDTTMSLALGESILAEDAVVPLAVANAYSDWLKAKPVDVGNTVRRGIIYFRHRGKPVVPENMTDGGNGACMRTLPVALSTLFQSEANVRTASKGQAHTTHNSPLSDAGTECITLVLQAALLNTEKSKLKQQWVSPLIQRYPEFEYQYEQRQNPTGYIVETLQAVFQAFFNNITFEDCVIDVVNRGGDADTTGAITGMLAGAYYGMRGIPERWLEVLDTDIQQACVLQAKQLIDLAMSSSNNSETSSLVAQR